ncbi:Na+/H+ antiporter NhaC family protein [Bacillus sp. T33-2]|uniref:Na+/H+ antiporter NhaC family protein n=1 Tax=Bacillus sp. T33-2 TaxID=2054168 RepID=UPI000C765719|nr:Na+/H+ antiporter NhaC family protein [Bacillus sp. T33-2]PLR94606.1 sodium:proton antiporter [Bacillus sp. T33-2]
MEYGALSLLPPLIAIIIALLTRQTLLSLFIGVWVGSTIINSWNPFSGFAKSISDFMIPSIADPWNASLLILVSLAGGFIHILKVTGAAQAFAQVATKKVNTRRKAQNVTWGSAFLFSYTEPVLILGTIMRPLTDRVKVSRVKLAYILDSMGAPLASMSPISSYGPFITGLIATQITALSLTESPWTLFLQMIPYNLYGIFAMIGVLYVINTRLDIGPMYLAEKRAIETGEVIGENDKPLVTSQNSEDFPEGHVFKFHQFLIPMLLLFATIFTVIFWTGNIAENGFRGSFIKANIVLAISCGFLAGSIGAGVLSVKSKLHTVKTAFDEFTQGIINLMIVPMILVLAWSIGKISGKMELGAYMSTIVGDYLPAFIVPALIFLLGSLIAFSTGSSWGVFAIMMPIAIPMGVSMDISLPLVIGAVISGGLFGDHCSPISDTTILASTGAACDHIEHVRTQLPYAILIAVCSFLGFLVSGLTAGWLGIITTAVTTFLALYLLNKKAKSSQKPVNISV